MPCDTHNPRPVPFSSLVEKNGSKMCGRYSSAMPLPVVADLDVDRVRHQELGVGAVRSARRHRRSCRLRAWPADGVEHQVQQHLLDLVGRGDHRRQVRIEVVFDVHARLAQVLVDQRSRTPRSARFMSVGSMLRRAVEAEHLAQDARDAVGLFGRDLQELGSWRPRAGSCSRAGRARS